MSDSTKFDYEKNNHFKYYKWFPNEFESTRSHKEGEKVISNGEGEVVISIDEIFINEGEWLNLNDNEGEWWRGLQNLFQRYFLLQYCIFLINFMISNYCLYYFLF